MAGATVRTCRWVHEGGPEAVAFDATLSSGSRVERIFEFEGWVSLVDVTLAGSAFRMPSDGPHRTLSPATSISVLTEDRPETNRPRDMLGSGGGSEVACGWLADPLGVPWQVVPRLLTELPGDPEREHTAHVHGAMRRTVKIDVAALEAA